jgi:ribosomal-protein-alanine N-acetyltransferase
MEKDQYYLITTARLGLRRWQPADLEPFTRMNKDPVVMEYFPRLMTAAETAEMVERIDSFFDQHGYGLYAMDLRSTGEFLGYTGFAQPSFESWFTPCVEIGWRLKKEAWGRGYATEAAGACLSHGFSAIGLTKVLSFTAAVNIRSERVMQKIGMTRVGDFEHPAVVPGHVLRPHVLYAVEVAART